MGFTVKDLCRIGFLRDESDLACGTMRICIPFHFDCSPQKKKKQERESKDDDLHQRGDKPHGPPPMALQALVILEVIPLSSIYNIGASTTTYINFDNGFFTEKTHGAPALTIQLQIVIPIFSSPSICARKKLWRTHKIRFTLSSKNDKYNRKVRLVFFQLVLQRVYLQYVYIFYRTLVFY